MGMSHEAQEDTKKLVAKLHKDDIKAFLDIMGKRQVY